MKLIKLIIAALVLAGAYHFYPQHAAPKNEGARILAEAAQINSQRAAHMGVPVISTPSGLDPSPKSALDNMFDARSAAINPQP